MARGLKSDGIAADVIEYGTDLFAGSEQALLQQMWKRAEKNSIRLIMIAPDQARLVRVLLRSTGARRALDVGTLFGYSAAVMARAMGPTGRVTSLEFEPVHAEVARQNLAELGLESNVDIRLGPALEQMRTMKDDSFDFVLIDADKGNYVNYLDESVRLVADGGLVAADNTFAFGKVADATLRPGDPDWESVQSIRRFNETMANDPRLQSVLVPIGDGLALGVVDKARKPFR